MHKQNIKKDILEKIKAGKIEQKSKWYFLTKSYVFWVFTALATLLGGFAFASILFQLQESKRAFMSPDRPAHMAEGFVEALPHWWVMAFVILIIIAYVNYKNTYKAYARENMFMLMTSLLTSCVIGFFIFYTGIAKQVEDRSREFFPSYKKHIDGRKQKVGDFLKRNGYSKEDMQNPEIRKDARELLEERMIKRPLRQQAL